MKINKLEPIGDRKDHRYKKKTKKKLKTTDFKEIFQETLENLKKGKK